MALAGKSLISLEELTKEDILYLLAQAAKFEEEPNRRVLEGKVVATLFFEPSTRTTANPVDAYQLPSYHLLDMTIGWQGMVSKTVSLNVFAHCQNLTNATYIERGTDGATHDLASFRGYWGAPRTMSLGMRVSF